MTDRYRVSRVLVGHFFRRFFDSDTIQADGETLTTVIRAVAMVAVPGLMVSFFLQNQYPQRPPWGAIQDQYFFVLFSSLVMGAVTIFEWEMLFPDRLDFLILSPLPIKPLQILAAKTAALFGFLVLFLFSSNLFAMMILPAVSRGDFFRHVYAHGIAVLLAGVFASFFFLVFGGVLLCLLGAARFRMVSPIMQMVSVAALVLLMLQYAMYGNSMQALLSEPLGMTRWVPPLWFLGMYEHLLHGDAAPAFAQGMERYAVRGTLAAVGAVFLTYPAAWRRMRKMAVEGSSRGRRQQPRWLACLVHQVVRRPGKRAVFHFIGQTIARNNRYQVYLAMYCGTGLALALACAVTFRTENQSLQPALSNRGLHAIMPLLLFWVIAGLRTAFAFPLDLSAGWIFRVTGVRVSDCAAGARRWVLVCAMSVMCGILAALRVAGWDLRRLLVQVVCGLCLCVLLTDGFFASHQAVPFNRPRMPGRTSLPIMLTLYVGVAPLFIFGVVSMEMQVEKNLLKLLPLGLTAAVIHAALGLLREGSEEIEEEMEGYEGEFQLLGLS